MSHSQTSVLQYVYRGLIALAAIAFIIRFRSYIFTSILPFFIAFILAGLMEPGIRYLHERLRMPRSAAVVAVFVLVMAAGGYITTLVTAKILSELVDMSVQASNYQATIVQIGTDILNRITEVADEELLPPQIRNAITNAIETFSEQGEQFAKSSIQSILDTFVALPGVLVVIVITGIATYFIAKDREIISKNQFRLAPSRWRGPLTAAQDHIILDMVRFLKAQFVLFLITTAVAAVGLYLLGIRYWMTLALVSGILDLIPVVGPGFLFLPWSLFSLLLGDAALAFYLLLIYLAIFLVRQLLQPKILGDSIGVHPLLMLATIYAGIVCFGVRGLIIGPLIVIVIRALLTSGLVPVPADEESAEGSPEPEATDAVERAKTREATGEL